MLRVVEEVREHPAPTGALRPEHADVGVELASSQGATNTIRCIKTRSGTAPGPPLLRGQGAPNTIRCIHDFAP